MDIAVLVLFVLQLAVGAGFGAPVPVLLAVGFALFFLRGVSRGMAASELLQAAGRGIWRARNVILTLLLIGLLTALWRGSGTVAQLVSMAFGVLDPVVLIPVSFLVCAAVSTLMGSSFATAATAGTVCTSLALACGVSPLWVGAAALGGCYVGDRCSPISTSALLIADLTGTELPRNLWPLLKRSLVPVLVCTAAYVVAGFALVGGGADAAEIAGESASLTTAASAASVSVLPAYDTAYTLGPLLLLPAASVILLACFRVRTLINVLVSCGIAATLCVGCQGAGALETLCWAILGYDGPGAAVGISGGGLVSMVNVILIIGIASTYAGFFEKLGYIQAADTFVAGACTRVGRNFTTVLASTVFAALCFNQTLAIMLTHQTMERHFDDAHDLMMALEDTVLPMAALFPWCIAAAVPLASMGVSAAAIPLAFFLWVMPLWHCVAEGFRHWRNSRAADAE